MFAIEKYINSLRWIDVAYAFLFFIPDKAFLWLVKCLGGGREKIAKHSNTGNNRIIFLVEHMTGRTKKIAEALYNRGWKIDLICPENVCCINVELMDFSGIVQSVQRYSSIWQLAHILLESDCLLIHYFTRWKRCDVASLILKHKSLFPKIVIERYDILNGMYKSQKESVAGLPILSFLSERFALENADGVIQREYALQYLEENMKISLPSRRMTFLDYYVNSDVRSVNTEESMSICYVGGLTTEKEAPGAYYACHIALARLCEKNECHYHIYPSFWDEERFKDYLCLEKDNNYFHIHKPVPYHILIETIKKHDYGIFPAIKNCFDDQRMDSYTDAKKKYASTNKYFDYLAAELPIIANTPERITKELEKDGLAIRWSIEEIDFDYLRDNKKMLHKIVRENREKWKMDYNINRLIHFYEDVSD